MQQNNNASHSQHCDDEWSQVTVERLTQSSEVTATSWIFNDVTQIQQPLSNPAQICM